MSNMFQLRMSRSTLLCLDLTDSQYADRYCGQIEVSDWDKDDATWVEVGTVSAVRFHASRADRDGISMNDVFEACTGTYLEIQDLLYKRNEHVLRRDVAKRFGATSNDLLILNDVRLKPQWRGQGVGLFAARAAVDQVGEGCGLTVAKIAPANPDPHEDSDDIDPDDDLYDRLPRAGTDSLRRYYGRMGFERIGRSPYFALPMNRKTPTLNELISGWATSKALAVTASSSGAAAQ